jgi:hypothetical protein
MQDHQGMQAPRGLKGFRDFRASRGLRGNRGIRGLKARQVLRESGDCQVLRENRDLLALPVLHAAKANVRLQSKGIIKQTAKILRLRAEALPEEMLPKLTRIYRLFSVKEALQMAIQHKQRVHCPLSDRQV